MKQASYFILSCFFLFISCTGANKYSGDISLEPTLTNEHYNVAEINSIIDVFVVLAVFEDCFDENDVYTTTVKKRLLPLDKIAFYRNTVISIWNRK